VRERGRVARFQRLAFLQMAVFLLAAGMPGCGSTPDVLRVTCDADGTHVLTPTVAARADGVHIEIPESGDYDAVEIWGGDGNPVDRTFFTTGHTFDQSFRRPLALGRWSLACFSGPESDPGIRAPNGGADTVEIIDPSGFFVSYGLSCGPGDRTGFPVPILAHATSVEGLIRSQLRGVLNSDVIEPAGYPASGGNDWRVARNGDVIGSLSASAESGNGVIFSVFVCASRGIARP
jgi:hypothetical protein